MLPSLFIRFVLVWHMHWQFCANALYNAALAPGKTIALNEADMNDMHSSIVHAKARMLLATAKMRGI